MKRTIAALGRVLLVIAAVSGLILTACSSDESSASSTDGSQVKSTTGTTGSTGSGGSNVSATGGGASAPAVDSSGKIAMIGKDNLFEPNEFTAKANQTIALTLDNAGAAIHNFQILGQKGPDGLEIQTPLLPNNQKGSVEFALPAGTYEFYCAVHPVDMRGKLTVE